MKFYKLVVIVVVSMVIGRYSSIFIFPNKGLVDVSDWEYFDFHRVWAVKLLIKIGADTSYRDKERGLTAMMHAAIWDQDEVVDALLEAGADPKLKSRYGGSTAYDIACKNASEAVLVVMNSRGITASKKIESTWEEGVTVSELCHGV